MDWSRQIFRLLLIALVPSGCGSGPAAPSVPTSPGGTTNPVFQLSGDPESLSGATWTYKATTDGVAYDLQGILLKPRGQGPFPAVIISHANTSNANGGDVRTAATEMVTWGLVCIGTNYTHAGGVPIGSPGTAAEPGASQANILRAHKLLDILSGLAYVDMNRVAAHGQSMGAFVTTALVGAYPSAFRVASHAAGGVTDPRGPQDPVPSPAQAAGIRTPYGIHHGDADATVPLSFDQRLASILDANGVPHELFVYPGAGHTNVDPFAQSPVFFARVRAWYAKYGLF
jgi:dienelactone hydrolase